MHVGPGAATRWYQEDRRPRRLTPGRTGPPDGRLFTARRFNGAHAHEQREVQVVGVELLARQLLGRQAVEERRAREHVAVAAHLDQVLGKDLRDERAGARLGDAPEVAVAAVFEGHPARRRERDERHAARLEHAPALFEHAPHVVDDVDGLREDDAIVGVRRQRHRLSRNRRRRSRAGFRGQIDDVAAGNAGAAVPRRVVVLLHLEHDAADVLGVGLEEPLDVRAVHGRTAVVAPVPADRARPPEVAPVERVAALLAGQSRRRPSSQVSSRSSPNSRSRRSTRARCCRATSRNARSRPNRTVGGSASNVARWRSRTAWTPAR